MLHARIACKGLKTSQPISSKIPPGTSRSQVCAAATFIPSILFLSWHCFIIRLSSDPFNVPLLGRCASETRSTLQFAQRAKLVQNQVRHSARNEKRNQEEAWPSVHREMKGGL